MQKKTLLWCAGLLSILLLVACQTAVNDPTPTATPIPTEIVETNSVPTATSEVETETAVSAADPAQASDLTIDDFFALVMADMLTRNPEYATSAGLQYLLEVPVDEQLTNESPEYQAETADLLAQHLETLQSYDQTELTEDQQLSAAVLEWYLEDTLRLNEFAFHDYRMNPMIGFPWEFTNLMHSAHPLTNKADAEAYISRLNQFDGKVEQLVAELEMAEAQGVLPPKWLFGWAINTLQGTIQGSPTNNEFYTHFVDVVSTLDTIPDAEKEDLYAQVGTAVSEKIYPGYETLIDTLQDQMSRANTDDGVWKHPNGDAYYQAALQHHTTTNLTADEIHEIRARGSGPHPSRITRDFCRVGVSQQPKLV